MPIIAKATVLTNTPPGWSRCNAALASRDASSLGFAGSTGDLNRFAARYRVAKAFTGVELEGFAPTTTRDYSSLFRLFLTWSAFESLLDACSIRLDKLDLTPYDERAARHPMRDPSARAYLQAVEKHLDASAKACRVHVRDAIALKRPNPLYVAKAIRHVFAHGKLAALAGAGTNGTASAICDPLVKLLFEVMDGEFTGRLTAAGLYP